jgi:PKD repeat protein
VYAAPGTYTVSLTVGNAGGSSGSTGAVTVGPAAPAPRFTMAQTLQDGAQRTTLAFSGLAMITGNLEAQSFFPPGKVADYTGFQYLRDNDPDDMGHNTSFLTRIANNVIYVLNDAQFAQLKSLAVAQMSQIDLYGYKRFAFMKAFRKLLDGALPAGATALDRDAVKAASRDLYLVDGQISFDRALLYAGILGSLDATQRAYLDAMKGKGWASWPDVTDSQIRSRMQGLPQGTSVAVMTYASDLFSWYAGSLDADTYFCPERQGTYYGGFYIKDAPAIGHEGYAIDEQLTATAGRALSDAGVGYVTAEQAAVMSSLVDVQRDGLYASPSASIVGIRAEISTLLRSLLASTAHADSVREQVLALSAAYGEIDGVNNHAYATVFAQVNGTLSADQRSRLMDLRRSIMSGSYADGTPFDFTTCTTPFLYSSVIGDVSVLAPYFTAADALFFPP